MKRQERINKKTLEYEIVDTSNLRPWSRTIPKPFKTANYIEKMCECGDYRYSGKTSEEHNLDHSLWERDHFFEISKPPVLKSKPNLPVEFVTSGYKVQEKDSN